MNKNAIAALKLTIVSNIDLLRFLPGRTAKGRH
jgi:hypothetical protein